MKNSSPNIFILVFALMLCSATYLLAQSAQPQNSNQNTSPVQHGTDGNVQNPSPNQVNPPGNPGSNTGSGTKPVNGSYGNSTPGSNGATGTPSRGNSGATGVTGVTGPIYNNNGSTPVKSPQ